MCKSDVRMVPVRVQLDGADGPIGLQCMGVLVAQLQQQFLLGPANLLAEDVHLLVLVLFHSELIVEPCDLFPHHDDLIAQPIALLTGL